MTSSNRATATKTVEAVKEEWQRKQVLAGLRAKGVIYADIWQMGVNTGLRISDLLALTMNQVKAVDLSAERAELSIDEIKTGKRNDIALNAGAVEVLRRRLADNPDDVYLFQTTSRRKDAETRQHRAKPINSRSVCRVLEAIGHELKLKLGTHSMRKTRGYYLHSQGVPIEQISHFLNHADTKTTMRYIGLTKQSRAELFMDHVL